MPQELPAEEATSFPCYKEGTGRRGQIQPGPPVVVSTFKILNWYIKLKKIKSSLTFVVWIKLE